jgi:hypothetical protein
MSRWRAPLPSSTAIITRAGFERLKGELDHLWHTARPEVVKALAAAAAEGDRSENAEYTYRKKQLAEIDRRVRYLGKRIPVLKVATGVPADRDTVFFGEISLSGDVRACPQTELRLKEAAKLGFTSAVVPAGTRGDVPGIALTQVRQVSDILEITGRGSRRGA